ncbi:hypothetical protein IKD56_00805 [bacterium]|nr:hypothetical protein [bacterium]
MGKNKKSWKDNAYFQDTSILNSETYNFYISAFEKVARSIFEWVNLPSSMNEEWLERSLYYYGMASLLKDEDFGFINTNCTSNGDINIYGLPTKLNCFSYGYSEIRNLYTGLPSNDLNDNEAVLVRNNWDSLPTVNSMRLFALRLYEAERICDVNIKAQKTPVVIIADDKSRLTMLNLYKNYDGNSPFIFGDKNQLSPESIRAIKTDAPFVADKIMDYKKEIWNEALTFLGINNIALEKKERLIKDEANSNNELINLNLQSYLAPRQIACKQFNEKFGFTGTDKEISVRVRSDLHNIIKNQNSIVQDFENKNESEVDI